MIAFQTPTPADRAWVLPLLQMEGLPLCDYSFPVLYCWKDAYRFQLARQEDRLLVRLRSSLGHAYLWPVGQGDPVPALEALTQDAHSQGQPLRLICLTLYHKNWLEDHYPGRFQFEEARDNFDYLYSVDRLADLPGKKLHAKRNHIHRFDDCCEGWHWTPFTQQDIPHCLAMNDLWYQEAKRREPVQGLSSLDDEHHALLLALDHHRELDLSGVVLRCHDQLMAFSLGAPLTDTIYDVHFERASGIIQGDYAAVNRSMAQFVRETYPGIRYLNREDDMGIPGLRKAKLSYYPDYLQVNFCAEETSAAP